MNDPQTDRRHVLAVAIEDYFQVGAFHSVIRDEQWYRFETRLTANVERTLKLLERRNARAVFFVSGWIADRFPELVKSVADRGHEVADKGYYHRGISQLSPEEFRTDALRSREAIEHATGRKVMGYRLADGWIGEDNLWALDVLAELGYAYDMSVGAFGGRFASQPARRLQHQHRTAEGKVITELPITIGSVFGKAIPLGGNYLRQLPRFLTRRAIRRRVVDQGAPLVTYFHVWELDPDQPRISASTLKNRVRHYRNLHSMEARIDELLSRFRFTGAADFLGLPIVPAEQGPRQFLIQPQGSGSGIPSDHDIVEPSRRTPATIVVPCFNEESTISYLNNTLQSVEERMGGQFDLRYVLVDDGSKDATWDGLVNVFGKRPRFKLHRHPVNKGIAAAILTGINEADTEIVCSIDADCSYDPHELRHMIPMLRPGVDLVTASPYHPEGHVRNVPSWRLTLSKGASWLYRRVLRQKLHTYTSCFRVYRRSAVQALDLRHGGMLGIAELAGRMDLKGSRITEFPATLESRVLGRSKMKTLRTIFGHLKLMTRLYAARLRGLPPTPTTVRNREQQLTPG